MSRHDQSSESAPRPAGLRAKLRGILIPFTTPFDAEGGVDVRAVRANVGRWIGTGVSGYVALGSTGERVHLDEDERLMVVEAAREAAPLESAYVVGVGAHSTRGTIRETAAAARAGADAVLVITPHFYRASMTQEALLTHYRAVADASPVPLILYNIPQNTGVALAPETVASLSEHANVAGIKDSSGDVVNFAEMLRQAGGRGSKREHQHGREFVSMTGHAGVLYPALAAGAGGAVLAVACVVPELCVAVHQAFRAGDHARARALGERLLPVARAVTTRYGIGGLKFALDLRGYAGGRVRAPLRMPDAEARSEIARLLEEAADFDDANSAEVVNRQSSIVNRG
ncbi:MAG TPA: dihydrodipicolinate synthase family protein [Pyrinomonadaceae bacterium]